MIDTEGMLTVDEVRRVVPGSRGAKFTSRATVGRWVTNGCPTRAGGRIKLKAIRIGSRWLIRPDDLTAFFAALTAEGVGT